MEIIKNQREMGKVFINKLLTGERQLSAAIRMYFLEEDPLAVHTVASAAHNILADLLQHRGKDASIHGALDGLLRVAKKLHDGKVSEDEIRSLGDGAIEAVREFAVLFDENPEFDIDAVKSSSPPGFARTFWSGRRSSYNYLKHADRDPTSLLDEAKINNEDTIFHAILCSQLMNMKHTHEKHFFYCAMFTIGHIKKRTRDQKFDFEFLMEGMSSEEIMALGRKSLCLHKFEDDDFLLETAKEKLDTNSKRSGNENILFFKED